ncbi:hypothetical protein ACRAWD_29475 [Caulobacter segnis]
MTSQVEPPRGLGRRRRPASGRLEPGPRQRRPQGSRPGRLDLRQSHPDRRGHEAHAEGAPKIIDSPCGKAIQFDGVQDVLFVEQHPLAGVQT